MNLILLLAALLAAAPELPAAKARDTSGAEPASRGPSASGPAPATDTLRIGLNEAVERALKNSEEMRIARADLRTADGRVREAVAAALPHLTGVVTYARQFESIFQGIGADSGLGAIFKNSSFGAANQWIADLTLSQLLYSGGKVAAARQGAIFFRQAAHARERETAADVIYSVKKAYCDAAAAELAVEITEANLALSRQHESQVALFFREGARAEFDLLRARVDAANQEPGVVAARNFYDVSLLELRRLIGAPLDQPLMLTTPLQSPDGTVPVVATDSLDPGGRGALVAAEADVNLQQQAIHVAHADYLPSLTASSTLSHQAFPEDVVPSGDLFRRNWNAEVKLSWAIFDGLRTSGLTMQAEAALARAQAERDRLRRTIGVEVSQARSEIERTRKLLIARRATVRQAKRAYDIAEVRYTSGMSTQLEVSDSRVALQRAALNEIEATRDYLLALANLERALGRPLPVRREPIGEPGPDVDEEGRK